LETRRQLFQLAGLAGLGALLAALPLRGSVAGRRDVGAGDAIEIADGWVLRRDDRERQDGASAR
jgi:hypothetical protein